MPTQTSYFQNDILAAASRDGSLDRLYWFVEAEFPKSMVKPGVRRRQPASWPRGFIPVVPAGPDPDVQRAWAEMLQGLFEAGNRNKGVLFKASLTTADLLDGLPVYEYGDEPPPVEVDHVCGTCGQITRAPRNQVPRCECYGW